MKKYISLALALTACSFCLAAETTPSTAPADIHNSFIHADLGLGPCPLPIPNFGAGWRMQEGHHGFDATATVSTIGFISNVKGAVTYNYYFKPNLKSQCYAGIGAAVGHLWAIDHCGHVTWIAPQFVFGKEYRNENDDTRFFQVSVEWPVQNIKNRNLLSPSNHNRCYFPLVNFTYGICF